MVLFLSVCCKCPCCKRALAEGNWLVFIINYNVATTLTFTAGVNVSVIDTDSFFFLPKKYTCILIKGIFNAILIIWEVIM